MKKKPKEKYFRTIFNTRTDKIEKFVSEDTLYNKYYFDPVAFAFSMDPLHPSPASISPYAAMNNNPIRYINPDGRAPKEYDVDKNTGQIKVVSDKGGNQTDYFNIGTTNEQGNFVTAKQFTQRGKQVVLTRSGL